MIPFLHATDIFVFDIMTGVPVRVRRHFFAVYLTKFCPGFGSVGGFALFCTHYCMYAAKASINASQLAGTHLTDK